MPKIIIIFSLLISNIAFANYAHIRSRSTDAAVLILDMQEARQIAPSFPKCFKAISKEILYKKLLSYGFNIQTHQLNILYELFSQSHQLAVTRCQFDDQSCHGFQGYYNYKEDNVYIVSF